MSRNKIGLTRKLLELNESYNQIPNTDLQGIVSAMAMGLVSDPVLRNYYEGRLLNILRIAGGNTNQLTVNYIKFQANLIKRELRQKGIKVM